MCECCGGDCYLTMSDLKNYSNDQRNMNLISSLFIYKTPAMPKEIKPDSTKLNPPWAFPYKGEVVNALTLSGRVVKCYYKKEENVYCDLNHKEVQIQGWSQ